VNHSASATGDGRVSAGGCEGFCPPQDAAVKRTGRRRNLVIGESSDRVIELFN
jgi:hypothetical protein